MQNWIVWNGTVFAIEIVFTLNWTGWNRTLSTFNCVWTKTTYKTEIYELDLFDLTE